MISLTVDASVFAIPPKDEDPEKEYKSINLFLSNIVALRFLEEEPSITVSYMNRIKVYLRDSKCWPDDNLKDRVENLKKNF